MTEDLSAQHQGVDNVIVVFARFARRRDGKCERGVKADLDFEVRIWRKSPSLVIDNKRRCQCVVFAKLEELRAKTLVNAVPFDSESDFC